MRRRDRPCSEQRHIVGAQGQSPVLSIAMDRSFVRRFVDRDAPAHGNATVNSGRRDGGAN